MSIIGNPIIVGKKPEQTKTVSPTTSKQIVTPDSGKVLSSVTVNAAVLQSKTVTPTASGFTVSPDSGKYGLSSVTVNGNSNLVAGNIKSGVTIFGVTGSYNPVTSAIVISGLTSTDTITCSGSGKSYTATWDSTAQHWEILGLPLGTFTITATNGNTVTQTVLIDVSGVYEIEMTHLYIGWYLLDNKGSGNDTITCTVNDDNVVTIKVNTTADAYTQAGLRIYNSDGSVYSLKSGDKILFSYTQSISNTGYNHTATRICKSDGSIYKTLLDKGQDATNYLYTAAADDESNNRFFRIDIVSRGSGQSSTVNLTKFMLNGINIPFKS